MNCTRCEGTGFLNAEQIPSEVFERGPNAAREWIEKQLKNETDAQVCDCCGDGYGWFGEPGQHYTSLDPIGSNGPYAYNGGLCECH